MIYIVKHKGFDNPVPEGYKPLGVGPLFEDRGENINHLNPVINELTALYDVWKNTDDEIVGFCHYHRIFAAKNEKGEMSFLPLEPIKDMLKDVDICLTYPVVYPDKTIEQNLAIDFRDDLHTFFKYMNKIYKNEPVLKDYFSTHEFNARNMFVCNRDVFEAYCNWLFPLIIPVAEEFKANEFSKYPHYYNRMIGFIAERLLSAWAKGMIVDGLRLKVGLLDYKEF